MASMVMSLYFQFSCSMMIGMPPCCTYSLFDDVNCPDFHFISTILVLFVRSEEDWYALWLLDFRPSIPTVLDLMHARANIPNTDALPLPTVAQSRS